MQLTMQKSGIQPNNADTAAACMIEILLVIRQQPRKGSDAKTHYAQTVRISNTACPDAVQEIKTMQGQ